MLRVALPGGEHSSVQVTARIGPYADDPATRCTLPSSLGCSSSGRMHGDDAIAVYTAQFLAATRIATFAHAVRALTWRSGRIDRPRSGERRI